MLYIDKDRKVLLPKKYHEANNICSEIYDQLSEVGNDPFYKFMWDTSIDLSKIPPEVLEEINQGKVHMIDALDKHGLHKELELVLTKHIVTAILSDFLNFIYESLSCAQRGKMEVAYSLLRKPFVDELLIFEQLLVDRADFIDRFFHKGTPQNYDPSDLTKSKNRDKLKDLLKKVNDKIGTGWSGYFSDELMYTLRYDKSAPRGINGLSNKALHIVTNDINYKTEYQELNFVFSTKEDVKYYWDHYYYFVPALLLYASKVVDMIVFDFVDGRAEKSYLIRKDLKRLAAFLIHSEKYARTKKQRQVLGRVFENVELCLSFKCDKCNSINNISKDDLVLFFHINTFLCSTCGNILLGSQDSIYQLEKFHMAML